MKLNKTVRRSSLLDGCYMSLPMLDRCDVTADVGSMRSMVCLTGATCHCRCWLDAIDGHLWSDYLNPFDVCSSLANGCDRWSSLVRLSKSFCSLANGCYMSLPMMARCDRWSSLVRLSNKSHAPMMARYDLVRLSKSF
jgi:hypothetical protein